MFDYENLTGIFIIYGFAIQSFEHGLYGKMSSKKSYTSPSNWQNIFYSPVNTKITIQIG